MDHTVLKKLKFTSAAKNLVINAPEEFIKLVADYGTDIQHESGDYDFILLFASNTSELKSQAGKIVSALRTDGALWVAYPKKTSALSSDLTRDSGWNSFTEQGFKGVSMISIDNDWSCVRLKQQNQNERKDLISDEAVEKATGKTWQGWFVTLNANKGKDLTHQELVKFLTEKHNLSGWWSQMVTNTYEKYINRRDKHQKGSGFEIGASKTIDKPVSVLYDAWENPGKRKLWMHDPDFEISTATKDKSIRALWVDGKTRISVGFYPKSANKTQVTIQHLKISTREQAETKKQYWKQELEKLLSLD